MGIFSWSYPLIYLPKVQLKTMQETAKQSTLGMFIRPSDSMKNVYMYIITFINRCLHQTDINLHKLSECFVNYSF